MGPFFGRWLVVVLLAVGLLVGCSPKTTPPPPEPPPESEADAEAATAAAAAAIEALDALREELDIVKEELGAANKDNKTLRSVLAERNGDVTALEEAVATLELELGIALEELIRSRANLKNVQNRAFAVSRIAEVRVELESFRGGKDPTIVDRLGRAESFLERADQALAEENWGGAAFLAERAGALVRQARTIAEIRTREPDGMLPLVPPRTLQVRTLANLRSGPSTEAARTSSVDAGVELKAIGRMGDWYQIELSGGKKAWVHRSVIE